MRRVKRCVCDGKNKELVSNVTPFDTTYRNYYYFIKVTEWLIFANDGFFSWHTSKFKQLLSSELSTNSIFTKQSVKLKVHQ